jgi:hypothetical protein
MLGSTQGDDPGREGGEDPTPAAGSVLATASIIPRSS